ncbi:MAG: SagB/ThcOx family dehydrogenase [Bryobacteraceae bacterium]|nr:SagB/ThcOx family dehydrogenase [Bryobacteraceae bacterium]
MIHILLLLLAAPLCAQPALELPPTDSTGGRPLMQALKARRTAREFSTKPLPRETLSNLLWAAYGINRPDAGGRTAPSAHNWQTIEIYAALPEGLFRYNAKAHRLDPVSPGDSRPLTSTQDFADTAPLNLVYVARMALTKQSPEDTAEDVLSWVAAEAGAIAQNVALYCASKGLANVVRAGFQRSAFTKAARLAPTDRILLAHTIGFPK